MQNYVHHYARRTVNSYEQARHHLDPSLVQKAIRRDVKAAGIDKITIAYTLCHSFATHPLERGQDMHMIQ